VDNWHILVVEDDRDSRRLLTQVLRHADMTVDAVETAEEAMTLLKQTQYTALISDYALPGMSGIQLIQLVRADRTLATLPAMMLSAFYASNARHEALAAGFDVFMNKPFDMKTLIQEIRDLLAAPA
jgi:DNA-binding response OmpR family regulator